MILLYERAQFFDETDILNWCFKHPIFSNQTRCTFTCYEDGFKNFASLK